LRQLDQLTVPSSASLFGDIRRRRIERALDPHRSGSGRRDAVPV